MNYGNICHFLKLSISRSIFTTAFHVLPDIASYYLAHLYVTDVCERLNKTKELV